jgi:hypothetical protein
MCLPMPWHPSIAQVRSGHCFTSASIARNPGASVAYRPPPRTDSSPAMTSMVAERLCGSIPMTTWFIAAFLLGPAEIAEQGGHRYFEQNKPLLSLSPAHHGTRPAQAKTEPHDQRGQPM